MISLLEKEARDPVEVLRVKLKDSTETSLLNSQLVRRLERSNASLERKADAFCSSYCVVYDVCAAAAA